MKNPATPRPASTVVLLRESEEGVETLLLKRNKALMFAGGFWVFPGGALEEQDLALAEGDELLASRYAAAREAEEESGLRPALEDMALVSHWITPEAEPKRFSTWIYAAPVSGDREVVIDGGEIHDHLWITLPEALAMHGRGELAMLPPTAVTLMSLASYESMDELLSTERASAVPEVMPVFATHENGLAVMFPGDAGYAATDPGAAGARHRVELQGERWIYCCEDISASLTPLVRKAQQ